jgi:hypothetical protein
MQTKFFPMAARSRNMTSMTWAIDRILASVPVNRVAARVTQQPPQEEAQLSQEQLRDRRNIEIWARLTSRQKRQLKWQEFAFHQAKRLREIADGLQSVAAPETLRDLRAAASEMEACAAPMGRKDRRYA